MKIPDRALFGQSLATLVSPWGAARTNFPHYHSAEIDGEVVQLRVRHLTSPGVAELDRRGWRSKVWSTRRGKRRGGLPIDKCRLHGILTNVLYVGKITHKKEVYAGEQEAIIPEDLFRRVQARLQQNRNAGNIELRNRYGALLRRLLYCKACGRVMAHTFTSRGKKRYRYYTCTNAIKNGRRKCPTVSLPAGEIEKAVVDQIRCIGQDPDLLGETLQQARSQAEEAIERLTGERRLITRGLARCPENWIGWNHRASGLIPGRLLKGQRHENR